MKKKPNIFRRIRIAYLCFMCSEDVLVEECAYCGSIHISKAYDNPVKELEDGSKLYATKYMCKKCGCTAHVQEVWDIKNR